MVPPDQALQEKLLSEYIEYIFPTLDTHAFKVPSVFQMSYFKQPIIVNVLPNITESFTQDVLFH